MAGPHPPPPVSLRRVPPTGPGRLLTAMRGFQLPAQNHLPAMARLDDEPFAGVARLWGEVHGVDGRPRECRPSRCEERPGAGDRTASIVTVL